MVLLVLAILGAPAAVAQSSDPAYGSPDPGPPPQFSPTCSASASGGANGSTIVANLQGAAPNEDVTVTLDGEPVTSGKTDDSGNASFEFASPRDDQSHTVGFVGAGFSCTADFDAVLGSTVQRTPSGGSSPTGRLPRTGAQIGMLVVIALALVFVGSRLVRRSRRQRRRIEELERRGALLRS